MSGPSHGGGPTGGKEHPGLAHRMEATLDHMKNRIGKLGNLINPNHRHDEKHEKETDEKRARICESHRFNSFAPERDGNKIKWYIDGRDYYHAVSVAFERARETIYIADWWLSPELFLRRPPYTNQKWRLDQCLKRAAERGVQIYIVVYKEVENVVSCNSVHTKKALRALCPKGSPGYGNIHIMRHPDHNVLENAGDMTFYWAHHEKFIVIDYNLAFIGGLDLCFGRWDTKQHPLSDVSPDGVDNTVWPGQDYNNNRIMDFQSVNDWSQNHLSKADFGRMPWHDVAMGVIGPCIYDIAEHFVLRWNFVKRDKYKRDERFDWLTMQGRDGADEDLVAVQRPKFPVGDYIHHPLSPLSGKTLSKEQGSVHAQIVRSSCDWSSGILPEHSIQNAYKEIIRNAQHVVYIENQFFETATGDKQAPVTNTIGEAIVDAIVRAARENRKFRIIVIIPSIPGFAGDLRSEAATGTRKIMEYQYQSINRGEHCIFARVRAAGFDPTKYFFIFNLRSYDRINRTIAMQKQEELSGVTYQELQRANAEEIMGGAIHGIKREDIADDDSDKEGTYDNKGDEQKEEFLKKKKHFESKRDELHHSFFNDVDGDRIADSADSIAKDALLGEPLPSEELWNKQHPDQEKENFIQEELYPHDKLLIVDDRIVVCGSSNINDRSQLGTHDSELAIVMEDTETIESTMDGKPYRAARLAATLRRMLWREHLGLIPAQPLDAADDPNAQPPEDCLNDTDDDSEHTRFVADPLDDKLWDMWTQRATTNTEVFRYLFRADPDDNILTFKDYDAFLPAKNIRQGHLHDPFIPIDEVRKHLDKIKGHLVWMPLEFLRDDKMAEIGLQVNSYTEVIYT